MKPKKLKKPVSKPRKDSFTSSKITKEFSSDREFAVILEKVYSEIKVIVEGQSALKDKFDMLFEEFGRQKEEIFIIKTDVRVIKTDTAKIKENLKGHGKQLTHLEAIK